jgi:WD40 repeat protein
MKAIRKNQLEGHKGPLYILSSFGDKILSGGSDRRIVEWDLNKGEGGVLANSAAAIISLMYLEDQALLLVGQMEGGVHVVDLKERKEIKYLKGHENYIFDIQYHPEKEELIFASGDGSFSVWSAKSFERLYHQDLSKQKLRKIELSADRSELLICRGDGIISRFKTDDYSETGQIKGKAGFNVARFSPDGQTILAGDKEAHLHSIDALSGEILQSLAAHYWPIYDLQFSPSGKHFATASRDKTIKIWDPAELKVMERIEGRAYGAHSHSVNALLWMDDFTFLSTGDDGMVKQWEIEA